MAADTCPTSFVAMDWSGWSETHILAPAATQACLTMIFFCLVSPIFRWATESRYWRFRRIVETFIGHKSQQQIPRPGLLISVYSLQAVSSIFVVCVWVQHTYWRATSESTRAIFVFCAFIDVINWTILRIQAECETCSLWQVTALIDVLTVVPSLRCGLRPGACNSGEDWLSLHFLRSFSVLMSLKRIKWTGALARLVSTRICTVVEALCEMLSVVVVIAGAMLTCELLGDPPFLEDSCVQSASSDPLSFVNMVYWTMVSITTVGYGDIAPRASISRILSSFCIVIGVATIFRIQYKFTTIWSTNDEGRGSYHASSGVHVVVVLNVMGRPAQLSTLLTGFLHEILHPAHLGSQSGLPGLKKEVRWPNIVVFAPALWDGENNHTFDDYIRSMPFLPPEARRKVTYIIGRVSDVEDLNRASVGTALLTFVVSNTNSEDPDEDDGQNIHAALILRDNFPNVRLRLMLLRPESKNLALQAGIEASRCFSIRELKANILAQNVRCHGLVPTISGMFMSADSRDSEHEPEPWMQTYIQGLQRGVYGFLLSGDHKGKTFGEVAIEIFKATNAILVGIFHKGRLILCPQFTHVAPLQSGQICFAIASRPEDLEPMALSGADGEETDWRVCLAHARDNLSKRARSEGVHVAAAKFIRRGVRQELLVRVSSRRGSELQVGGRSQSIMTDNCGTRFSRIVEQTQMQMDSAKMLNQPYTGEVDARSAIRQLRENLQENEELVLLVVCNGIVWQQVATFVSALCANYQPVQRYVVVLAPTAPPSGLFDEFDERVFSMRGSYTSARILIASGLLEARAVVVMSGEPPREDRLRDPMFQDYQVILCAQIIECWCSVSARGMFAVYELQNSLSARQLPALIDKPAVRQEELFGRPEEDEDDDLWAVDDFGARKTKLMSGILKPMSSTVGLDTPKMTNHTESSLIFHPRFAAGQIFTPEVWGVLMGRMFYMPAVIELLEAVLMPHLRGQPVFTWQFRVPEMYAGKPFMRLFQDLLEPSEGPFVTNSDKDDRTSKQLPSAPGEAVVPLSILRRRETHGPRPGKLNMANGTGAYNYNILAPCPTFQLLNGDWVTALGSRAFGARIHEMGLLRGCGDMGPSTSSNDLREHIPVAKLSVNGHPVPTNVGRDSGRSTHGEAESVKFLPAVPECANHCAPAFCEDTFLR